MPIAAERDVVVVDVIAGDERAAGEIGMVGVDAGVDDGHANAGAAAEVVRLHDVERADIRLQPRVGIVGPGAPGTGVAAGAAAAADSNSLSGCTMSTRLSALSFSIIASRVVPGGMRNSTQCILSCSMGHSETGVSEYWRAISRRVSAAEALTR